MSTDQIGTAQAPDAATCKVAFDAISLHLAEAFISSSSKEVHAWARGLAHALQSEGVDLLADIGARMQYLALGPDDIPF